MGLFTTNPLEIDQFKANFDNGARTNRFEVDFHVPAIGLGWEGFRVETCTLPGRQLETAQFSEYGAIRNLPFNVSHDGGTVDMTFICDSSFADRFLLEAWQSAIYSGNAIANVDRNGDAGGNASSTQQEGSGSAALPYFSYYNDYIGDVDIVQLRMNGEDALRYRLFEAYPVSYAPMEMNATSTDDILRFQVTFAFRYFSTQYVEDRTAGSLLNRGRKILDIILDGTKLASRFNSNAGKYYQRLSILDEKFSKLVSNL